MNIYSTKLTIQRIRFFGALLFCLLQVDAFGQLVVNTGQTAQQYAQELVGAGVTISNATFSGVMGADGGHVQATGGYDFDITVDQIGNFTNGGSTNIGIDAGLVLSTGNAPDVQYADQTSSGQYPSGYPSYTESYDSDPDLNNIGGGGSYNCAVLEFDFIPEGSYISFSYVFASSEYPGWVDSPYNDVFGFFLSGPGINGPYSNSAVNIATIPNSSTPVSINTVNGGPGPSSGCPNGNGTNMEYYVDNCASGALIPFGGFTVVLTAEHEVVCGETYHIKLAIGDIDDVNWDSAIFLQKNSLLSDVIEITPQETTVCTGESATLTTTLPVGANQNGTYYWAPDGQTTPDITVSPNSTTEYIVYYTVNGCEMTDTAMVIVDDCSGCTPPELTLTGLVDCIPNEVTLSDAIDPSSDQANTTFYGTEADAISGNNTISENISSSGTYWVRAEDPNDPDCFEVYPIEVDINGPEIEITETTAPSCEGGDGAIGIDVTGGTPNYTYEWLDANDNIVGTTDFVEGLSAGTYSVSVTDDEGCSATEITSLSNPPSGDDPSFQLTDFCAGASNGAINISPTGGEFSIFSPTNDGASIDENTGELFDAVGGTTYSIEYTVVDEGCSYSSVEEVIVSTGPEFTLSSSNPSCGNNDGEIVLNGLSDSETYTLTYTVNGVETQPEAVTADANGGVTIDGLPLGNYSNFVLVTGDGCTGSLTDVVNLVEPGSPTISAPDDMEVCLGEAVTISADNPGNATVEWSNGLVDGEIFTPSTAGVTTYTVTASLDDCSATASVTVTVNELPNVSAGTDQAVCEGESITLNGNGAVTYTWSPAVSDGVAFEVNETTIYEVTGVDENGCENTDEVTIVVEEPAVPVFNELDAICEGDELTLASTSTNGINGTWSPAFDNTQTTTYTFTPNGNEGCAVPVEVTILVNEVPIDPTVITTPADCDNPSTSIISNYNPSNEYTFTPTGPFFTEGGVIDGMIEGIEYTVSANNGMCSSGESESFSLTVLIAPEAQFNTDGIGCAPVTAQFENNSGEAMSYLWEFGDGSTSTEESPTHVYNEEGCYDVTLTVTNADGCMSTITEGDVVCVASSPVADFTTSTNELDETDEEVIFYDNSNGATSYDWIFGNGEHSTDANPIYSYEGSAPGDYIVTLIVSNDAGCTDTARTIIHVPEDVTFYVPNSFTPDGDAFNGTFKPVFSPRTNPRDYEMLIFNRWGELIFETHDVEIGWDGSYLQNKQGLVKEGIYIWKVTFKKNTTDDVIHSVGHVTMLR